MNNTNYNRILVTGAGGSLGQMVVAALHERKGRIRALLRRADTANVLGGKTEIVIGDLGDPETLRAACKDVDVIIHLAGITHTNNTDLYYRINYTGTKNLIAAAPDGLKKFIYISTAALGEKAGPYGHSKQLAEEALARSNFPYCIIRPSEVYGAPKAGMIEKLVGLAQKYPIVPLIGNGNFPMAPVHVDDVVGAIVETVIRGEHSAIYTLAGPETATYRELVDRASAQRTLKIPVPIWTYRSAAYGLSFITKHPPLYRDQIPRFLAKKNYDIKSAQKDLSYKPRTFERGFKRTIKV